VSTARRLIVFIAAAWMAATRAVADVDDEALRVAFDAEKWARRLWDLVVALDEGTR
jgi:hypothetical protein